MATNENALAQPKFDIGICGRLDHTTKIVGKILIIFHGRGAGRGGWYPSMENSMKIIKFFSLETFTKRIKKPSQALQMSDKAYGTEYVP